MRIKNKSDLPVWATPEKYSVFAKMDDDDFIWQIIIRFLDSFDGQDKNVDYFDNVVKETPINKSLLDKVISDNSFGPVGPHQKIHEEFAVKPLSVSDIAFLHDDLMMFDSVVNRNSDGEICVNREANTHVDVCNGRTFDGLIHCSLDLNFNDEIIIGSLARLLPLWRKQLNIKRPVSECEIKTSWAVNRSKIISYQAFLFYDLNRWQLSSGKKVTNSIMAATLYPGGEYGEIAINQTIKSYVEKIFSLSYVNHLITGQNNKGMFS